MHSLFPLKHSLVRTEISSRSVFEFLARRQCVGACRHVHVLRPVLFRSGLEKTHLVQKTHYPVSDSSVCLHPISRIECPHSSRLLLASMVGHLGSFERYLVFVYVWQVLSTRIHEKGRPTDFEWKNDNQVELEPKFFSFSLKTRAFTFHCFKIANMFNMRISAQKHFLLPTTNAHDKLIN